MNVSSDNSEALRELDAWIAVHVFGWKWYWYSHTDDPEYRKGILASSKFHEGVQPVLKNDDPHRAKEWDKFLSYYTVDSDAAMEVLKACILNANLSASIEIDKRGGKGPFRVETVAKNIFHLGIHDTLEMAICIFAKSLFSLSK